MMYNVRIIINLNCVGLQYLESFKPFRLKVVTKREIKVLNNFVRKHPGTVIQREALKPGLIELLHPELVYGAESRFVSKRNFFHRLFEPTQKAVLLRPSVQSKSLV